MSSPLQLTRRPYTGSCHCGHVKYIVYLTLPTLPYPPTTQTDFRKASGHRIYKCNCTICHKASLLHIRTLDAANDFFIVSPKNPMAEGSGLKAYVAKGNTGPSHFCEYCGVRGFTLRGEGYSEEVELPTSLVQRLESRILDGTAGEVTGKEGETTRVAVWRPKKDWHESQEDDSGGDDYLSVNGVTLDAHNENFDLRQLHEKGYVGYMQTLQWVGYDYEDKPYFGGAY